MDELNGYFAVHSQGLGHASRSVALARGLLARRPELGFLFLAGSPALDLAVASGFDALTMPPAPDWPARDGAVGPMWRWYRDYARYYRVARRFMRHEGDWSFYRFLISDSELASAGAAVRHGVPTALILNSVRHDFTRDAPSRLAESVGNAWLSRLARRADLLLVVDDPPPWPNVRAIGPIVRPFSASRERLREDLYFRKRTILVTPGGTAIGEFVMRAAMDAFRELDLPETSMVVVSGPKLKVEPAPGVYTYGFVPNLQDMVLAADLVVTTAGKGTIAEARAAGTPLIAIPPNGQVEAERNAAALGFHPEDVHRLKELIREKLDGPRPEAVPAGNEAAVGHLIDFLEKYADMKR